MTTDAEMQSWRGSTASDTLSSQTVDWQSVGRNLFAHRYICQQYESSAQVNPMVQLALDVFSNASVYAGYAAAQAYLLSSESAPHQPAQGRDELSEEFKYLARGVSGYIGEPDDDYEVPEVHDHRESGLVMDWQAAGELWRKMKSK